MEERKELDQMYLSNVEDGSMITQYCNKEIAQLVPISSILTPTQIRLMVELGEDSGTKI